MARSCTGPTGYFTHRGMRRATCGCNAMNSDIKEKMSLLADEALVLTGLMKEYEERQAAISLERVNLRAECLHPNSDKDMFSRKVCSDCGTVTDLSSFSW